MEAEEAQEKVPIEERPFVSICYEDGKPSGAGFHGVPGGHEFQSFVVGLYNGAGPGQELEDDLIEQIKNLPETHLQIIVSLTCTQCPDLVTAAQKIAFVSDNVTADVYDVNHFSELKEKYDIMSVILYKNSILLLLKQAKVPKKKQNNILITIWAFIHGLTTLAAIKNVLYDKNWKEKITDFMDLLEPFGKFSGSTGRSNPR